ncbi:MAG: DUF979 family protein [Acetobacter sp.]|jgi:uncharacterized membrane protein
MVGMEGVYAGLGLFFFYTAYSAVRHGAWRRATVGGFWGLYGLIFISGSALGDFANGLIIIGITILAVCMRPLPSAASNRPETAVVTPEVIGGRAVQPDMMRLFLPLLVVPVVAVLFVFIAPWLQWYGQSLIDPQRTNQIGYVLATLAGLVVACWWLRPPAGLPFAAGSALVQRVGWPLVLPQILAMLGGVYMAAGVNHQLGALLMAILPSGNALVAVLGYTTGMMLVSALVGNAFAAFPILFGALGLPVLVGTFGLSPAPVAAVGMLCGFCGTLLTPMAVNFNIVPVSLLGLKDRFAVIRAQMPAALFVFAGNSLLLYTLTFFKGHSSP